MDPLRILLVEDSADDADLILLALAQAGLRADGRRVDTADAMRAALGEGRWDLVISDFNLPRFSAAAALELLRRSAADIPFIVASGFIGEEAAVDLLKSGAHDFVRKDNLARLVPAIERELREAENRRAHRAASEALARSEKRLHAITAALGEGVFVTDAAGALTFMNPEAERLLGWTERELAGRIVHDLIHRQGADRVPVAAERCGHAQALRGAALVRVEDDAFLRKDGTPLPVASVSTPIVEEGRVVAAVTAFQDITERKRAAAELLDSRHQLRALSDHLQAVREEERAHIARELHDELGQMLTALKIDVTWMQNRCPACADAATARKLGEMGGLIDETIAAVRRIAADLRPVMLDDLGLKAAVEWLVEEFARRNPHMACESQLDLDDRDLDDRLATAAFRIVQECLTNIARHAQAGKLRVFIGICLDQLAIAVQDNGRGLSPQAIGKGTYGLLGMRERAAALGGKLQLNDAPGGGLIVEALLPLHFQEAAQ